jgi:hypothetical protein
MKRFIIETIKGLSASKIISPALEKIKKLQARRDKEIANAKKR